MHEGKLRARSIHSSHWFLPIFFGTELAFSSQLYLYLYRACVAPLSADPSLPCTRSIEMLFSNRAHAAVWGRGGWMGMNGFAMQRIGGGLSEVDVGVSVGGGAFEVFAIDEGFDATFDVGDLRVEAG